jgi:Tfp pilus assembly protein PilF
VLETLPGTGSDRDEIKELKRRIEADSAQPESALRLARLYIEKGRSQFDPRAYGHAEAVLQPWLGPSQAVPEALLLRATVRQNRHDFAAALTDLEAALQLNPRMSQAWLTRAAIQEVQGDYPAALRSCMALSKWAEALPAAVCLNSALGLSGQLETAYQRLSAVVDGATGADQDQLLWARVVLAEMAERLGRRGDAESWYRRALGLGRRNGYLLATYADFLLDGGQPEEVVDLLAKETRADPLLLRLALAEQNLGSADFPTHQAALADRFAASRLRGDAVHQADEARYALQIAGDSAAGLSLALANWAVQREPRDARIVLEAARKAGRPQAARPVLEFLGRTGLEDIRLRQLAQELSGIKL